MTETINVILDLSNEVQELIEQQQLDLYSAVQEEIPSIRLAAMSDPEAPTGSKEIVTVIIAAATLISALTPLVIRILNQYKPDTTELVHEETETLHPDGSITIHRIHIYTKREYNQQVQLTQLKQKSELPQLKSDSDSSQVNH